MGIEAYCNTRLATASEIVIHRAMPAGNDAGIPLDQRRPTFIQRYANVFCGLGGRLTGLQRRGVYQRTFQKTGPTR